MNTEQPLFAVPPFRTLFGLIPVYSFLIVCGAALAIFLACREERRAGLPKDTIIDLCFWLIPFGIIGARIYYVIFAWDAFRDNPVSILYIWEGGIAIYGAVIAGLIVILVFCRRRRLSVRAVCDVIAPGLVLAQAIGRWGNYFNQEAYGEAIVQPVLQFFPLGVLIDEGGVSVWHMATFFYESLWNVLVFILLMIGRRKWFRKPGDVFGCYAFCYSAGRLLIEDFRMDSLYAAPSLRASQLLALLICAAIWFLVARRAWADSQAGMMNLHSGTNSPAGTNSRAGSTQQVPSVRPISRPVILILAIVHYLYAVVILLYCFSLPVFGNLTLAGRALLLGGYSLTALITCAVLYGKSDPSEVCYAIHSH